MTPPPFPTPRAVFYLTSTVVSKIAMLKFLGIVFDCNCILFYELELENIF